MKFSSRKFVTVLVSVVSLVVLGGTAAATTSGQNESTHNDAGRSRVVHNPAGPIRIMVHGAW